MFEAPSQVKSAVLPGNGPGAAPVAGNDLLKMLTVLWGGRATILAATVAALLLAALFVLFGPHSYTATTEILIDPADLRAVADDPAPSARASDTALLLIDSQVRVLSSDDVLRRVVVSEGLAHDPEFVPKQSPLRGLVNTLFAALGRQSALPADPSLTALNALRQHVRVTRAERTYVVDVAVTSRQAAQAPRLANAIAEAYLAEQTQVRADAARQISRSLSARLDELKASVKRAEDKVEAFRASHNIVDANGKLVNEQQLSDLNNQLAAARARTAAAKARLDEIEAAQNSNADSGAFPEAVQSQTITALRSQYAEIMRLLAQQTTSLGDRHPAVIEIRAQAERLKRMIAEEVQRIALASRAEYQSAKASENLLQRSVDALKQNALATDADMITLRELQRDVQASRAVYEAFLVRARETSEQERVDTKNIQVISRANLPSNRSWPPSNKILALGAILLGIAAGSGLVLLRQTPQDKRPRSDGGVSSLLKLAIVRRAALPPAAAAPAVPVLAKLPGLDGPLGPDRADEQNSRFAAGIRNVYEAVRATHGESDNPSILIIATDAGDDTASVALMLAALAAATQHVLLIDTDLERRTIAAINNEESEGGLVDVALGRRLLSDVVVRDRTTNINLLPFVSPNSRRDRIIRDEDIKVAFAQTKHFDMVIVAAPDLRHDPSARFFAGLVDHIVLVTKAEAAGAFDDVLSGLGLDARKVRGAVLTGAQAA
ncbi:MAG: exopolysaccharide transport family protein [Xanthobacteraceae bacterium]